MSLDRALRIIRLEETDRVGQYENLDHPGLIEAVASCDPWENPRQAFAEAFAALDMDWAGGLPTRSHRFADGESSKDLPDGRRMTEWGITGSSWREEFAAHTVEEVLAYEPEVEISVPDDPCAGIRSDQEFVGDATLITGIYYTTLFQHPIMTFGWELFLEAAAAEPERFQRVLESFARVSRRHMEAWARNPPALTFIHDDVAMEQGMVFHPDWYRQRLFPLYEQVLEPVFQCADTRTCFVSDGDYTPVLPDLVALGFDGFVINDNMDLGEIARQLGADHFLAGNVRTSVLTLGRPEQVVREVERCLEEAKPCAGHFIKATRDLPHNIPLENIRAYFDAVAELGRRG